MRAYAARRGERHRSRAPCTQNRIICVRTAAVIDTSAQRSDSAIRLSRLIGAPTVGAPAGTSLAGEDLALSLVLQEAYGLVGLNDPVSLMLHEQGESTAKW